MTRSRSAADRWRRFWYLQQTELWLEGLPGRRRRTVLAELRSSIDAAAHDVGMTTALADLGRPRALAAQYLEAEPARRPHWSRGALAAGLVLGAWLYATLFYTLGMLDALESAGAPRATGSFLGTSVRAVFTDQEISAGFSGAPWFPVLLVLLTFLLVGRAWNALPGRRVLRAPAS